MLGKVIIENGVKKIQALTADTGVGAPVGSYLYLEKKSNPQGYLYCDGSTFDETVYPALYQYLGTNVLPDWREFSAVGAEQNTTNVYDAQTNPYGVIHDHDVYTEGQAKDDQIQNITGRITTVDYADRATENGALKQTPIPLQNSSSQGTAIYFDEYNVVFDASKNARAGTVTRGKRKAVFIYIKATSGLTENQQENVLNTINENNSYSTEEHPTGKKWIDGKPIYSKTLQLPIANGNNTYPHNIANIEFVTKVWGISKEGNGNDFRPIPFSYYGSNNWTCGVYANLTNIAIECGSEFAEDHSTSYITIEYTKTTD